MENLGSIVEKQKKKIIQEIDNQIFEAINTIRNLNEVDFQNFRNNNKILHQIDTITYNLDFNKITDCIPILEDSIKEPYNTIKVLILGDTNVGKSTLGCKLTGAKYFPSSDQANTFCKIRLISDIKENAKPFRVLVHKKLNNNSYSKPEFIPETLEKCIELIEQYKRSDEDSIRHITKLKIDDEQNKRDDKELKRSEEEHKIMNQESNSNFSMFEIVNISDNDKEYQIEQIDIYVKHLSHTTQLLDQLIIEDTPGANESYYNEKTFHEVIHHWDTSILLVVVDIGCGTLRLSSLDRLLEIYKKNKCTERIIFVFTKVINQLQTIKSKDEYITTEEAIITANKILKSFKDQMESEYPNASYIFFDQDKKKSKKYLYHKTEMRYIINEKDQLDHNFISIGEQSIHYLKQKINNLANKIANEILRTQQLKKLQALICLYNTMILQISQNEKLIKQIQNFKLECENVFQKEKQNFKKEIANQLDFHPNNHISNSSLKTWLKNTINNIDQNYKGHVLFNKANYQRYINTKLQRKIQGYIYRIHYNALDMSFENIYAKFFKLLGQYNPNIEIFLGNSESLTNYHTRNICLVKGANIARIHFLAALMVICTKNAPKDWFSIISAALSIAAVPFILRDLVNIRASTKEAILNIVYEKLTTNQTLINELEELGVKEINVLETKLQQNCIGLFELNHDDLPGWTHLKTIQSIIVNVEMLIKRLNEILM